MKNVDFIPILWIIYFFALVDSFYEFYMVCIDYKVISKQLFAFIENGFYLLLLIHRYSIFHATFVARQFSLKVQYILTKILALSTF